MTIWYSDKAQGLTPWYDATHVYSGGAVIDDNTPRPWGTVPPPTPYAANETVHVRAKAVITSAGLGTADTVVMCCLPAGMVPVDAKAMYDDLDTSTGLEATLSVLDNTFAAQVASTNFFYQDTTGRAGGVKRADLVAGLALDAVNYDRWIGFYIDAGATGAEAGNIYLDFSYRAKQ